MKKIPNRSAPFLILLSVAAAITGCHGVDFGNDFGQSQTSCDDSIKDFSPTGAARPNIGVGDLPPGIYTHTTSEVFVSSGNVKDQTLSRIQYFTAPASLRTPQVNTPADLQQTSVALRCRENSLKFNPISEPVSVPTVITRLKNGNIIDTSRIYNVSFSNATTSSLIVSDGGTAAPTDIGSYSYGLGRYWFNNFFTQRSGDIYEFYGKRQLSNDYVIYSKAVYIRTDLPLNSP